MCRTGVTCIFTFLHNSSEGCSFVYLRNCIFCPLSLSVIFIYNSISILFVYEKLFRRPLNISNTTVQNSSEFTQNRYIIVTTIKSPTALLVATCALYIANNALIGDQWSPMTPGFLMLII